MHADVQKYFDAQENYQTKRREALDERDRAVSAEYDKYDTTCQQLTAERDAAREALRESSDPLVAWIAKVPMRNYPDHATEALKILPATREDLDALAARNGWCAEWDRFMDKAEQAGVLPGAPQRTEETQQLLQQLESYFGTETFRTYRGLISTAIKAEVAAALAAEKTATATAEAEQAAK